MRDTSQTLPAEMLIIQFLEFVAARPRRYGDVMEAWRTSCPRLPAWEEAVERELVKIEHTQGVAMADCPVVLTERGQQMLCLPLPLAGLGREERTKVEVQSAEGEGAATSRCQA
jgi:hypothetical protein